MLEVFACRISKTCKIFVKNTHGMPPRDVPSCVVVTLMENPSHPISEWGDFRAYSVEILVFPRPTDYML